MFRIVFILALFCAVAAADPVAWVNEFHYDNTGTDTGEFVEIAAGGIADLSTVTLTLYNGTASLRSPYDSVALNSFTAGATVNGITFYSFSFPSNGIQNGAPDGFSLDIGGTVIEFLSYEGTFLAASGPAVGLTSTDIGVSEGSGTAIGASLGRTGAGRAGSDFFWTAFDDDTPGAINLRQSITDAAPIPEPSTLLLLGLGAAFLYARTRRRA